MSAIAAIDFLAAPPPPADARGEPDWLQALRDDAYRHFLAGGLPTRRNEDWKYTNLRGLQRQRFAVGPAPAAADAVPSLGQDCLAALSFVNGRLKEHRPAPGLSAGMLSDMLTDSAGALENRLGATVDFDMHPVAALNSAYFEDAVVIDVAAGQKFEQPLLIEFVSTPTDNPALICPRVLILMGKNSRLAVIERYAGLPGAANYTNAVTEVQLEAGARLDHYRLQELAAGDYATGLICAQQAADSRLVARGVDMGGKLVRNDFYTRLAEPGASTRLAGFYLAVDSQHVDNHTRIDHAAPHTGSHEAYHGVLAGRARAVFNGKVVVAPDAQKVDAHQSNRNLLLSGTAEIDTKPELEIYADDVRCSHGATVGQIDEDALFYLRSRGVGERTARALLTFAFADEVLRDFDVSVLREYIEARVTQALPDHEKLEHLV